MLSSAALQPEINEASTTDVDGDSVASEIHWGLLDHGPRTTCSPQQTIAGGRPDERPLSLTALRRKRSAV
jgi:hypothetical protein